jgi:hypothetical protein
VELLAIIELKSDSDPGLAGVGVVGIDIMRLLQVPRSLGDVSLPHQRGP